jgi:hypothetical protein
MRRKKIVIITPFNDIEFFEGGSRSSIKQEIPYFDQFLILHSSIVKNWRGADFDFSFLVLHSLPFNDEKRNILASLESVEFRQVWYEAHETKIRPMAYRIDVDCDFRLILDIDMYALNPPTFNFDVDAQAMYGGNKYNSEQWDEICEYLGAKKPRQLILKKDAGDANSWGIDNHVDYHLSGFNEILFPYFNNGAVLVRNDCAKKLGEVWNEYKLKYIQYVRKREGLDHEISAGQNMIGLAIANSVDTWAPFEPGINFIVQRNFEAGLRLIEEFDINKVKLFHYINVPEDCVYERLVMDEYEKIKLKIYSK